MTVFFEKENLDTREPISEFIFTTLGALAQEEEPQHFRKWQAGKSDAFFQRRCREQASLWLSL